MKSSEGITYGHRIDRIRTEVDQGAPVDEQELAELLADLRSLAETRNYVMGLDGIALSAIDGLNHHIEYLEKIRSEGE